VNEKDKEKNSIDQGHIEDTGGLAYKDMNDFYYYIGTLLYYGVAVLGSCIIPSVDEIFEFVGTICVNCMGFIFPAMFYLTASKRYYAGREGLLNGHKDALELSITTSKVERNLLLENIARLQLFLGMIAFVLGMFNNIYGLINHESGEHSDD